MSEKEPKPRAEQVPVPIDKANAPEWMRGLKDVTFGNISKAARYLWGEGAHYFDELSEIRRQNKARDIVTVGAAEYLVKQFGGDDQLAQRALQCEIEKLCREQQNKEQITQIALEDMSQKDPEQSCDAAVDDDWINRFYDIAKGFSAEHMKLVLGKILSGELQQPGSFSLLTLQALSTLDKKTIALFSVAASCVFHIPVPNAAEAVGGRICAVGESLGNNGLLQYVLGFKQLLQLQEHGLVSSEINQWQELPAGIFTSLFAIGPKEMRIAFEAPVPNKLVRLQGVALTKVGFELFQTINKEINEEYTAAFVTWLREKIN